MYTVEQLISELSAMVDNADAEAGDQLMLNVAGRWTGIKGITVEAGGNLVLIESED